MAGTSGGLGDGTSTSQSSQAAANRSKTQGSGKLLGPRSARDMTKDPNLTTRSVPPPPMPPSSATQSSPQQQCGNAKVRL
jgi:hypothetical protein